MPSPTPEPTLSPEDYNAIALDYFSRVGFRDVDGQLVITRWQKPITLAIVGSPTPQDRALLESLVADFGIIEGIPAITLTNTYVEYEGITFAFLPISRGGEIFNTYQGDLTVHSVGYYTNRAHPFKMARTLITDEITDQTERNTLILHYFLLSLGLQNDREKQYGDSALNGDAGPPAYSDMDYLMVRLLYNPAMDPTFTHEQALDQAEALLAQWSGP